MATTSIPTHHPNRNLFAAVDMGTNSFKLLIVHHHHPTGKFIPIERFKEPVLLGRTIHSSPTPTLSPISQSQSLNALKKFAQIINHFKISKPRFVATAAVREALNRVEFVDKIRSEIGVDVDVLSGEDEARLIYLGVLQFLPVYGKRVLNVDIGGGSTEFVIGFEGDVIFGISLKLGHVWLTEEFVEISKMRSYIRSILSQSCLPNKVKELGFEIAVGSSGTVRAIEKAIFSGYGRGTPISGVEFGEFQRDWKFNRVELSGLVEKLCGDNKFHRDAFFKRRSEFIIAGAVLLEEIFMMLGIDDMAVSGYALGEGVVSETLASIYDDYDVNANARWRSVMRLAIRFNSEKRMKSAVQCAEIAKDIFEGLRMCNELDHEKIDLGVSLDEKDLECLEAACLLHNIGLFIGKKGYHKLSFHIIMNGGHLHGYSSEEVKLIALLAKHHRKKFPKTSHNSLHEFPKEVKKNFRILCAIIRISFIVQQYTCVNFQELEFSHSQEGFKLVLEERSEQPLLHDSVRLSIEDIEAEMMQEIEHFKSVFHQDLSVVISPSNSESSEILGEKY